MQPYQSHRDRLIVSADDFGVSPRANRNTLYLLSLGKIDRVGIMPEGTISPKEIEQLNKSAAKIDIHLDILHELDSERKKRTDIFKRGISFLGNFLTGKYAPTKIENDWRKQIELFREKFGRTPDGITSHEHVHFFPPFFRIALKLQEEYGIPYIRIGKDSIHGRANAVARILNVLRILNLKLNKNIPIISSNSLVSLDWISNVDFFLDHMPEGTIEIACHPELAEDFVKIKKYF